MSIFASHYLIIYAHTREKMRAHTRKTMKHEQENMKELLKKKYLSPLIESYDMVGTKILDGSNTGADMTDVNNDGTGGNPPEEGNEAKFRSHFGFSHFYENGYDE